VLTAHLKHGLNRVVVFDIDLHHGNGTQAIAWSLNEEAFRAETEEPEEPAVKQEEEAERTASKPKLKVFYGSLHDILSYPCEVSCCIISPYSGR
jgi:histone deacetylase HOS3